MSAVQTITKQETQTAVRIKSIKIEKLFEIFDYDIEYARGEHVLIISGPNGFGKTTILNVLYHFFNREFDFFKKLIFDKILISFSDNNSIEIVKTHDKLSFNFYDKQGQINEKSEASIGGYIFPKEAFEIISSVKVHLIKEQRLYREFGNDEGVEKGEIEQETVINSINLHSHSLKAFINHSLRESYSISQKLDSTYTTRLISEKRKITREEYDERFTNLRAKQNKLIKYGLYEKKATLEYSAADAKALLVYLDDLEKKLSVFDELLEKFDLFTDILNVRRFTFKVIKISPEKGFYFETSTGKKLKMNELSSGEQHQVVLLYELIFNTNPSTLVLIDEPEISLHITWQKEFVKDLLKITKIQNFQVMIATHAPAIVNDRWYLVYNLAKAI